MRLLPLLPLLLVCACIPAPLDSADTNDTAADTADTAVEPEWSYSGATGPEHWGELDEAWATCGDGTSQSPIDIATGDLVYPEGELPPTLAWTTTALSAYNPGYYLRYEVDPGSTLTWNGAVYDLLQFHFHGLSEHTFDGSHTDVEIHFVHARQDDPTKLAVVAVAGAVGGDNGVQGVFGEDGSLRFREALALDESHEATELGGEADLGEAFSFVEFADVGALHYTGSLTTPPCTEGVDFFILAMVVELESADVAAFHAVFNYNYRPAQPLNGRTVSAIRGAAQEM